MMKKILATLLLVTACCFLTACGKSEEVKNAEAQIATLDSNSTYKEINAVYEVFNAVPYEEREKVENVDVLKEYCDPYNGHLVLTDEMCDEIEAKLVIENGMSDSIISAIWELVLHGMVKGWTDQEFLKWTSSKQEDDYTYTIYGLCRSYNEYGKSSEHTMRMEYFAVYDEETGSYKIDEDLIVNN